MKYFKMQLPNHLIFTLDECDDKATISYRCIIFHSNATTATSFEARGPYLISDTWRPYMYPIEMTETQFQCLFNLYKDL
jgi:hypothetical protein